MIDTREWKQHREMIITASDRMSVQIKRDLVFMGKMSRRQRVLRQMVIGAVTAGLLITGLLSISDAANGAQAASLVTAPDGTVTSAKLGMSYYSDYLFVLAVPFAVALLGHVSVTLSRIHQKLG